MEVWKVGKSFLIHRSSTEKHHTSWQIFFFLQWFSYLQERISDNTQLICCMRSNSPDVLLCKIVFRVFLA
ncbi:hypothetical protein LDENG_00257120 [Lucifuga dentata]|nr:hypothetical protein LDENG_00257120 [Lucifuga dentata]